MNEPIVEFFTTRSGLLIGSKIKIYINVEKSS